LTIRNQFRKHCVSDTNFIIATRNDLTHVGALKVVQSLH